MSKTVGRWPLRLGGLYMRWTWILALIVALLSFTVALQNSELVIVKFLVWQVQGPLALVLLLMFIAGFAGGVLATVPAMLRRTREIRRLRDGPQQQGTSN